MRKKGVTACGQTWLGIAKKQLPYELSEHHYEEGEPMLKLIKSKQTKWEELECLKQKNCNLLLT